MAKTVVYKVNIEGYEAVLKKIGQLEKSFKLLETGQQQRIKTIKDLKDVNNDLAEAYTTLIERQNDFVGATEKAATNITKLVDEANSMDTSVSKGSESFKEAEKSAEGLFKRIYKLIEVNASYSGSFAGVTTEVNGKLKKTGSTIIGLSEQSFKMNVNVKELISSFNFMSGAVNLAVSAGKAMIEVGADLVNSALEQEKAEGALSAALGLRSEKLIEQAAALQQKSQFSDQEIMASQAVLAEYGLVEDQISQLTPAILDYAAAQGITASEAADVFTQNMKGSSTSLNKFGIDLKGAQGDSDKFKTALNGLQTEFGGMAEEAGNKGSGAIEKLKNNFEEAKNQLGNGLLKVLGQLAPVINPIVIAISDFFKKMVDGLESSGQFNTIIAEMKEFLSALSVPVQLLLDVLGTLYEQIFLPIYDFIKESLVPVFVALQEAFTLQTGETTKMLNPTKVLANMLSAVLKPALDAIAYVIKEAVIPFIKKLGEWIQEVSGPISDFATSVADFLGLSGVIDNSTTVIDKSFGKVKGSADECTDAVEGLNETMGETQKVADETGGKIVDLNTDLENNAKTYETTIKASEDYIKQLQEQIKVMEDTIAKQQEMNNTQSENDSGSTDNTDAENTPEGSEEPEEEGAGCPAEKVKECNDKELEANIEKANNILNVAKDFVSKVDALNEEQLKLDLARIEQKRGAEIEAVEASALSEEEKQAKLAAINDKYDKQAEQKRKAAAKRKKALAITTALINGALAVTQAISQFGPPPSIPGIIGIAAAAATTAIQVATIAKQKFAKGGVIPFADGGMIDGPLHSAGGVPFSVGGSMMEAEGGELIVNRNIWSRPDLVRSISEMNAMTGGKRFFAAGGVVPQSGVTAKSNADIDQRSEVMTQELVNGLRGVISEEVGSLRVVNNVVDTTDQQVTVINQQTESSF